MGGSGGKNWVIETMVIRYNDHTSKFSVILRGKAYESYFAQMNGLSSRELVMWM